MKYKLPILKGRGAQINTANRFHLENADIQPNKFDEKDFSPKTTFIKVHPKTILNKVDSPDVAMNWSLNPYQGCEHGCVYCYARNSHNYWGYSAGLDFESKILVKHNAAKLLRKKLASKNWKADPIMLSGNTDCYQPAEKKFKITRQLLEVFNDFGHPVGIVTKNDLILRDLDLLQELHRHRLIKVAISINTLDETIRSFLEPRTSTIQKRLEAVKKISDLGIPVTVLAAPIIPGLTSHGILALAQTCAKMGSNNIQHILVRLNGDIAQIFEDWVKKTFPDRSEKVLNQIASTHKGKLNDSEFKQRMRGSGPLADVIADQFRLARKLYFSKSVKFELNCQRYENLKRPKQFTLF
jgi:DNA repair photolyase